MGSFEVSFNSPQCGWMSIGLSGSGGEFHSTTANSPHASALSDLMTIIADFSEPSSAGERLLKWNRDPEEFDFLFKRSADEMTVEVRQYPTGDRAADDPERVFFHRGDAREVCQAFLETFRQLYNDRETDEFEFNWRQPFPETELRELERRLAD